MNSINTKLISVGSIYKYKELCATLDEDAKTGGAKVNQLNRWRRYFNWENPTKQTYKITKIYDNPVDIEDGRKNNGGYRSGCGAKGKLQDEFDYLFNMFLHMKFNRNVYNGLADICNIHFSNNEISRYFGMYGRDFYSAKEDFSSDSLKSIWDDIYKKVIEKRNSWIYKKIDRIDKVEFGYGIVAYKDEERKDFEYKDEWLERWNRLMRMYLRDNGLRSISDVIDKGLWDNMISDISGFFDGYNTVEKVRTVRFDVDMLVDFDIDMKHVYVKRFNDTLCDELRTFFKNRVDSDEYLLYEYIISRYVEIHI